MRFTSKVITAMSGAALLATGGLLGAAPALATAGLAAPLPVTRIEPVRNVIGITSGPRSVAWIRTHSGVTEVPNASYSDCNAGNVCFYTGFNGSGSMCKWSVADPDWTSGAIKCGWASTHNVESVYNHGTSTGFSGVRYYLRTNYQSSIGCTPQGKQGNLAGTYQLRSHQWVTGNCG